MKDTTQIEVRKLRDLTPWSENPQSYDSKDIDRLKKQIERLGVYKPFLVNQDNIILGGNKRHVAMTELGIEDVHVVVVQTENEAEMLEYALSDNDSVGVTDEAKLVELTNRNKINTEMYAVQLKPLRSVQMVLSPVRAKKAPDVQFTTHERECPACGFQGKTGEFKKVD